MNDKLDIYSIATIVERAKFIKYRDTVTCLLPKDPCISGLPWLVDAKSAMAAARCLGYLGLKAKPKFKMQGGKWWASAIHVERKKMQARELR